MVANSMAQVYSANAVGYVNLDLPTGLSLIANPLNASPDNDINNLIQFSSPTATGTTIFRFDAANGAYGNSIQFIFGVGWVTADPDPNWRILDPGVAFFIRTSLPQSVTFVGEVPQGQLANPVKGLSGVSLLGSQVPQEGRLGHITDATGAAVGLEFPAGIGDTVFTWDVTGQTWSASWQYLPGIGWLTSNPNPNSEGPLIPVATGFASRRVGPDTTWDRDFNVNQ
jgi:hypothetical protein